MPIDAPGRTISGAIHDRIAVNGTHLHCVSLGTSGSPVLLVHGFPETWWAFHKLMPLLAERHRVHAVDLRGFGDSDLADGEFDSTVASEDLHQLIAALGEGPVHLVAQDISGTTAFRLAATHPDAIASFTAIELGLPGFGLRPVGTDARGGSRRVQYSAGQLEQARLVVALRATVRTTSATVGRCAQPSER